MQEPTTQVDRHTSMAPTMSAYEEEGTCVGGGEWRQASEQGEMLVSAREKESVHARA